MCRYGQSPRTAAGYFKKQQNYFSSRRNCISWQMRFFPCGFFTPQRYLVKMTGCRWGVFLFCKRNQR
ncbi:hypothetical protein B5E82_12670 [Lachnoclostridium sp. An138]|nr:hypothetical protein B5E82_12670 [Lachnoclostridium sp. An138]